MNKILWNSIKSPLRYFLVPAGEDVFAGEYQIENGDGEEAAVDLESIVPFEINEKEAEAIMMNELENMTAELGGLFKELFTLGKRMINSELMDEDSEDWDSDEDSESSSDWDSDDSDFDEVDLEKVISLFDIDSDEDSESSSDFDGGSIEELLTQFGEDLEGPLTELRDLIVQEVGNLGEELDKLGSEAARNLDSEPGAGQDILRELGQWLINLADERAEDTEEDVVVMEFKPKDSVEESIEIAEDDGEETYQDDSEEDSSSDDSSESEESSQEESEGTQSTSDEETDNPTVDPEAETDTSQTVEFSTKKLPSASALKRMTKAQLVKLGTDFGITLDIKDTKKTLLEQLETIR